VSTFTERRAPLASAKLVDALEIVILFGAQRAARKRMFAVARQSLRDPVPYFDHPTARVRTIVPARAADDLEWFGNEGHQGVCRNAAAARLEVDRRVPRCFVPKRYAVRPAPGKVHRAWLLKR